MPDDLANLEGRVDRLEEMVRAEALPPAAPGVRAVAPDVADGQVITAAHINSIKNSVYTWQAGIDGNNFDLTNVAAVHLGAATPLIYNAYFSGGWKYKYSRSALMFYDDGTNINVQAAVAGAANAAVPFAAAMSFRGPFVIIYAGSYADDAGAAAGGVPIGGVYRTGNTLKIRIS